jgi:hypothetical protein
LSKTRAKKVGPKTNISSVCFGIPVRRPTRLNALSLLLPSGFFHSALDLEKLTRQDRHSELDAFSQRMLFIEAAAGIEGGLKWMSGQQTNTKYDSSSSIGNKKIAWCCQVENLAFSRFYLFYVRCLLLRITWPFLSPKLSDHALSSASWKCLFDFDGGRRSLADSTSEAPQPRDNLARYNAPFV